MDDPKFSFQRQGEERRRRELIPPSFKRKLPSWKVTESDKQKSEPWCIEFDAAGKICRMEEMIPPTVPSDSMHRPSARSKFEILLTEDCLVGSYPCEAGCRVIAFSYSAGGLFGRGKILAEERNAF